MTWHVTWPWSHRAPAPDPKVESVEERVSALEERAEAADDSLRAFLRFRDDPWTGPVLSTIYGRGRRRER